MFKLYRRFKGFLKKELRVHSPTAHALGNVDTCVACGDVIPEDRQVCLNCEWRFNDSLTELNKLLSEENNIFTDYKKRCDTFGVSVSFDIDKHYDEYMVVTLSMGNYSVRSYVSMYLKFEDIQDALNRLLDRFIERSKNYIVEDVKNEL